MVFSNLLFLYVFLPMNLLLYSLAKTIRTKNAIMLVFSLMFYAWGEPKYVVLLIGMALADWGFALLIERHRGSGLARLWVFAACFVSLGLLGIFKYGTFALTNLQALSGFPAAVPQIALPIGISFYTFQILSYVIDVYRGEVVAQRSFPHLLMYVSLFHQCIAGPIVRYKDISDEIFNRRSTSSEFSAGVTRFATGLAKKALLANTCGSLTDTILLADKTAADLTAFNTNAALLAGKPAAMLWLGVLAFALQIYIDFSAYSDMAIGMGKMIGFHYKENFNYPYTAYSVSRFWRQWHISLGSFFRDYVYFPLGGNRRGTARTLLNLFIVWLLTGFWHGASWNFVLWGLYFFVFIALEKLFLGKWLEKAPRFIGRAYQLTVVYFGWILFRFRSLPLAWIVFKGMFAANGNPVTSFEAGTLWLNNVFFLIIAVLAATPLLKILGRKLGEKAAVSPRMNGAFMSAQTVAVLVLILLSTLALVGNSYNPFLYFQF